MNKKIAVLACGWSVYYLKEFIEGIKKEAASTNTDFYIFTAYNYVEYSGFPNFTGFSIFNIINYEDFDGIILLADLISNPRIIERERQRILKSGKPAVSINKKLEGITCIHIDNYSGLYSLLDHLIKMHNVKDIAYLAGKENSVDMTERYKAYSTALAENGIPLNQDNVFSINKCDYHLAYHFFSEYVKAGKKIPEAIVCANDLIALAVLKVCEENKIAVPEKFKIIGYDNLPYGKCTQPSISTVTNNVSIAGAQAVKKILSGNTEVQQLKINTLPVIRQSCGCAAGSSQNQSIITLNLLDDSSRKQEFDSHMELLGEIFIEAADVFTLLTNLETYLNKSHSFEGEDFCIFMKSDWTSVLINSAESLPQNLSYGDQVQSICSIQNNVKYPREMIPVRELIPAKMKGEGNNVFLFLPIYHHSYVHGYYVAKNNLNMLENRNGYIWSRNLGTSIEHFRKRNMFKQMSQQYLKLSTKDALSGMLNRQGLDKLAKPFYAQNKKNGLTTVLFFVDINKMKHINDQFGHLHGDLAVKTVAAAVLETVPRNWLCIRYGGDEFLVVGNSKNYNGEDYCTQIKERLLSKTSVMHLPYTLSASVGTYSVPAHSDLTLEQAVETVDNIMYEQKQAFHKEDDKKTAEEAAKSAEAPKAEAKANE